MSPCAFNSRDTVLFLSFGWSEGVPFARSTPCSYSRKGGAGVGVGGEVRCAPPSVNINTRTHPIFHREIWGGGLDRLGGIRGRQWKIVLFGCCLVGARRGGETTISYANLPYLVRKARYVQYLSWFLCGIALLFQARPGQLYCN